MSILDKLLFRSAGLEFINWEHVCVFIISMLGPKEEAEKLIEILASKIRSKS